MKLKKIAISTIATLTLAGCVTAPVTEANKGIKAETSNVERTLRQGKSLTATAVTSSVVDSYYLGSASFKMTQVDKLPDSFKDRYVVTDPNQISLQELVSDFGREFGVRTVVSADAIKYIQELESGGSEDSGQQGVSQNRNTAMGVNNINSFSIVDPAGQGLVGSMVKFSVDFDGTGADFLDYLTSKTNLFWKWESNKLVFFRTDTRTFKIDYLGGTNVFNANVSSTFQSQGGGGEGEVGQSLSNNNQSTNMSYSPENVWTSLGAEIESLKSEEGRYAIAEEAGIITVTDTPENLDLVENYIKELNDSIGQQIAIRAEIYDIVLDANADFGTNWQGQYSGSKSVLGNFATAFGDAAASTFGFALQDPTSGFNDSKLFINSLNEVADVSYRTSATVHTTNGMAAPIQMLDTTGYLASVTREISGSSGLSSTSVEQGTARSGFSLSFLPRVTSKGQINMAFAGDLTQLRRLNESTFEGTTIQLPESQNKNFLQRVIVNSGQSIMVAGFERTENRKTVDSLAGESTYMFGGRKSGGTKRVMTVIVLTPYIK